MTIQDVENGEISLNGNFRYDTKKLYMGVLCVVGRINFKINIYVKDGRYKYVIHNLVYKGSYYQNSSPISYGLLTLDEEAPRASRSGAGKKAWPDIKEKVNEKVQTIISGLKEIMNKKHETSKTGNQSKQVENNQCNMKVSIVGAFVIFVKTKNYD
ncbi:hypothetical protein EGY05_08360 [Chryseobacterium arthrosphaerae]|nr:hypothetical protein EGY05_08360 [Chryseobacterium arthrosphaerae]